MYMQVNLSGKARKVLHATKARAKELDSLRRDIAEYMVTSVKRNFEAGGRPRKWVPSRRAATTGGKTLIKTARLKNSISGRVRGDSALVGTNVAYAGAHQKGVKALVTQRVRAHFRRTRRGGFSAVRPHTRRMPINIPARRFLLIQREDRRYINRKTLRHLGLNPGGRP